MLAFRRIDGAVVGWGVREGGRMEMGGLNVLLLPYSLWQE